jgi:hypothetical protein
MLTPEELAARIGVAVGTLQNWRTRRNCGEEIGPPFVKLGARRSRKAAVRYRIVDVEAWERELAEQAQVA